jgi:hypothetical protein
LAVLAELALLALSAELAGRGRFVPSHPRRKNKEAPWVEHPEQSLIYIRVRKNTTLWAER